MNLKYIIIKKVFSSLACNLDGGLLAAALPLFQEGRVAGIEWSFDSRFGEQPPDWFHELLLTYGRDGRLMGHGVFFSLFSGRWSAEQQAWLQELNRLAGIYRFTHVTEHFGFMTGRDFHHGAPLSVPFNKTTLNIGRDRLARIQDACRCPAGLENLAFSYSPDEVKRHGAFLEELVAPVNGFIILDLHNFYCQMHNFSLPWDELLQLYPLHRVREIHISGGSWDEDASEAPEGRVRRDTHDHGVPEELFRLLRMVMASCSSLRFVVLEQMGFALKTEEQKRRFCNDFVAMEAIVAEAEAALPDRPADEFLPERWPILNPNPVQDETLYAQQLELSDILESVSGAQELIDRLHQSSLAATDWNIEQWQPYMTRTAAAIAQKWKKV